jgi:2-polyprenyl-6-methoxyphenol hydroxylase-like FAD-dependent oxidoreductase
MPGALVIGGGPAGATAACCLAEGGWQVTLAEADRFPRDKVCGECFSALGRRTLEATGLADSLKRLQPIELRRWCLISPSGRSVSMALPSPMWGLTRRVMDPALLDAARGRGVEVLQPTRVQTIRPGKQVEADLRNQTGMRTRTFDHAILADGKGSLRGAIHASPGPTGDLGLKAHFTRLDLDEDTIYLLGLRGHYVGIAPVSDGPAGLRWNLAMSVPADVVRSAGRDFDILLTGLRRQNPALEAALRSATRVGEWKSSPLPRFAPIPAKHWPAGVTYAGNAAAALEPVGGEGMGLAVHSGHLAARALLDRRPVASLRRDFVSLWRTRRTACRSIAMAISRPPVAEAAVRIAGLIPSAAAISARLAGKKDRAGIEASVPSAGPAR